MRLGNWRFVLLPLDPEQFRATWPALQLLVIVAGPPRCTEAERGGHPTNLGFLLRKPSVFVLHLAQVWSTRMVLGAETPFFCN